MKAVTVQGRPRESFFVRCGKDSWLIFQDHRPDLDAPVELGVLAVCDEGSFMGVSDAKRAWRLYLRSHGMPPDAARAARSFKAWYSKPRKVSPPWRSRPR